MPSEALLDVNVIIASVFADHVMHLPARSFVESLTRFYTTPTVQGGLWTDAYLLHIARKHSLALASLESRMSTLDSPATPLLFVVS
jgi:predicted nucleic acid-binding protein